MKTTFQTAQIIDREEYINNISSHIDECIVNNENSAIFLYGPSGIGKSSIMRKLNQERTKQPPLVIVETPPINQDSTSTLGQYLSYIAQALNKFHDSTIYSLEFFLSSSLSKHQSFLDTEILLDNAHTLTSALISLIGKSFIRGKTSAEKILWSNDVDSYLILKEYIKFALTSYKVILNITNAQNIDSMTNDILFDCFYSEKPLIVIFEYTTQEHDELSLIKFAERYRTSEINLVLTEITSLPFEFALTIYDKGDIIFNLSELEHFYNDNVRGNLYKLHHAKAIEQSRLSSISDPTKELISRLSYGGKLILGIICLHNGKLSSKVLADIINKISDYYYVGDGIFDELDVIIHEDSNGNFIIDHASVIESFGLKPDNYAVLSACRYLIEYYIEQSDNYLNSSNNFAFLCLLRCYAITEYKSIILDSLSEKKAFAFAEEAYLSLPPECSIDLRLHIVNLCYEIGLYEGAYILINQIKPPYTSRYHALRCMILNRIDKHEEAIKACKELIDDCKDSTRYSLILKLIYMLSERSLNRVSNYRSIFEKMLKNKKYKSFLEYGFLLRNAQIVYSYRKSLRYIEKSINFFQEKNEMKYAADSKLTYAVQKARLGELEESQKIINEIKPHFSNTTFERHILTCNEIAIRLLNHDKSQNTMLLLEQSLLTTTTTFDKLVLLNNYLCFYILNEVEGPLFNELEARICNLIHMEPDKRHCKKTYTNLYLYHKYVTKNIEKARAWRNIAISFMCKDSLVDAFLGLADTKPEDAFLASNSFCVFFITLWHFDIPAEDL